MRCEKCGQETAKGDSYTAYFGKVLSAERVADESPLVKSYQVSHSVEGSETGFICRKCFVLGFLRSWVGLGIMATIGLMAFSLGNELDHLGLSDLAVVFAITVVLVGFILWGYWGRGSKYAWEAFGDHQLIRAKRSEWEAEGCDLHLTRRAAAESGVAVDGESAWRSEELEIREIPQAVRFFQESSIARAKGVLSSLGEELESEKGLLPDMLMTKYDPEPGSPLYRFLTEYDLRQDEFLVFADLDPVEERVTAADTWFVLTNYRLIQRDGRDDSLRELSVTEIVDCKAKGIWTKSLTFRMKSGETLEVEKAGSFPAPEALTLAASLSSADPLDR